MKKVHEEIMWLFLKVSLLAVIIGISSNEGSFSAEAAGDQDTPHNQNGNYLNFNQRMSNLEAENRQQKQEMAVMKTTIDDNRKEMENMNGRVTLLEQYERKENQKSNNIDVLSRPKRKLPSEKGKEKSNTDTGKERFYGPPTSCDDLQKLGYTLNGYYQVKGKDILSANRIQVVYCKFQQPKSANKQSLETWIGNLEVKTKSVHFYVQRSTKYRLDSGRGFITFDVEVLSTGEFTAPVNGIYHFEFRCLKDQVPFESTIYLVVKQKNQTIPSSIVISDGKIPIVAGTIMSNLSYHSTGSLTASLKLKTNDVVKLYSASRREYLYDSRGHYTQYAGWLVEEDLVLA